MSDSEMQQGDAYDPTNTGAYDEQDMLLEDDEDDDYDPSNMQFQEPTEQATNGSANNTTSSNAIAGQPPKKRTVGGFIEEDSDEEDAPPVNTTGQENAASAAASQQRSVPQTPVNAGTPDMSINKTATPVPAAQGASSSSGVNVPVTNIDQSNTAAATNGASGPTPSQTPIPAQSVNVPPVQAVSSSSLSSVPLPKARLPQDRVGILEDRIAADPRGDTDAWLSLIEEYKQRNKIEEAYETYDRFFKVFPQAGDQWAAYIQTMMQNEDTKKAAEAFNQVLLKVPHVKCWSLYIEYIRRLNPITGDPNSQSRTTINSAFEFTFKHIGQDPQSSQLWSDYITFVKTMPGMISGDGWQDKQKVDAVRKAYRQALSIPLPNLQQMWSEYSNFEISASRVNGRKLMNEQMPAYMTAKQAYFPLENKIRDLNRSTIPRFPPLPGYDGFEEHHNQLRVWSDWIEFEKSDPNLLKEDKPDGSTFKARVLFVYRIALMTLRFEPQMWFDAAQFCLDNGLDEDGEKLLDQGFDANPESVLLAFAKADRIETKTVSESDPAERGKSVRQPYNKLIDTLYELLKQTKERQDRDVAEIQERYAQESKDEEQEQRERSSGSDDGNPEDAEARAKDATTRREAEINDVKESYGTQLHELRRLITTAWVSLIRAMRRIQGKGKPGSSELPGSRGILSETRRRGNITSDLYIQCALTEWYCYKDPASERLFEKGLTLYPNDENFALEYIKHLVHAKYDFTNARTQFEKTVSRLSQDPKTVHKTKPLYYYFHDFESKYGELAQIQKLEQRMRDLFPEDPKLQIFAHRFEYENATRQKFDPTAVQPIVSPGTQLRVPTEGLVQSIEGAGYNQPGYFNPAAALATSSPKRPYGADGSLDGPPRKIARGESPLKGAAGRRLANNQRQGGTPLQQVAILSNNGNAGWPVPQHINFLLSVLPNARHTSAMTPQLDPLALVNVMRGVNLQPNIWGSANLRTAGQGLMDPRYLIPGAFAPPPVSGQGQGQGISLPPSQQFRVPPNGIPMPGQFGAPPPPQHMGLGMSAPPPMQGGFYPSPMPPQGFQPPPMQGQQQYSQPPPQYATPVNGMYAPVSYGFLSPALAAYKQDGVELWRRFV